VRTEPARPVSRVTAAPRRGRQQGTSAARTAPGTRHAPGTLHTGKRARRLGPGRLRHRGHGEPLVGADIGHRAPRQRAHHEARQLLVAEFGRRGPLQVRALSPQAARQWTDAYTLVRDTAHAQPGPPDGPCSPPARPACSWHTGDGRDRRAPVRRFLRLEPPCGLTCANARRRRLAMAYLQVRA